MKLSEKKKSNFTPHPDSDGESIKAVIVDITELKKRETQYGEKEEFRLVFETECMDTENDRRFCIWSRGYTPSLNEKAALRKDLKKMMGRGLTSAELNEFDLEGLIGMGVKMIVQHEHKDDRTYANISFLAPDKDKTTLKPSGKYKRIKDREVDGADIIDVQEVAPARWEDVTVHIGKYKGKKLGDVEEAGVATLIEKWLPQAKAAQNQEDADLVAALTELSELLGGDDY
jgi:hypothetical protein